MQETQFLGPTVTKQQSQKLNSCMSDSQSKVNERMNESNIPGKGQFFAWCFRKGGEAVVGLRTSNTRSEFLCLEWWREHWLHLLEEFEYKQCEDYRVIRPEPCPGDHTVCCRGQNHITDRTLWDPVVQRLIIRGEGKWLFRSREPGLFLEEDTDLEGWVGFRKLWMLEHFRQGTV